MSVPWLPPDLWRPTQADLFTCSADFWESEIQNRHFALLDSGLTYTQYLRLDEYGRRRRPVLKRASRVCEGCRRPARLQIHHLHYQTIWKETPDDLVAVCSACHDRAHGASPP